jgi:hypothetical protein
MPVEMFPKLTLSLCLVLLLAACMPAPQAPEPPPQPAAPAASQVQVVGEPRVVALRPFGLLADNRPSTVAGLATLTGYSNGQTLLEVSVANLPPNLSYAANLRLGTCSNLGQVALNLGSVFADGRGVGRSSTRVSTSQIPTERATVVVYQRDVTDPKGIGGAIACGEL